MFFALDQVQMSDNPSLRRSMLVDRGRQFVERHRWPLVVDAAGLEVDEYDDGAATYCVVAEAGRHLASVRLRPAGAGCMVERHFPSLWRGVLGGGVEITRFCAAPQLTPDERLTAVSDLLLGVCRHCLRSGVESFFGVVFPAVARALMQAGWRGEVVDQMRDPGGTLILAQWTPSELVAWSIQERREMREEIWARRREEVRAELLAA
jgi:N-acyl-L-homoserine lactone synthetase